MTTIPLPRVGVDWDGDGMICFNAVPTDPLNLFPYPVTFQGIDLAAFNGNAATPEKVRLTYADYRLFIGLQAISVVLSAGTDDGLTIGETSGGSINDIAVSPSTQYTISFYIKLSASTVPVKARVVNQAGSTLATSTTITVTTTFVKYTVTFTTGGGDSFIALRIFKDTSATTGTLSITGLMLVTGAVSYNFNAGTAASRYENITEYKIDFRTKMGYNSWEDTLFSEGTAEIKLDNRERLFSPEYVSSPIYGAFVNRRRVEIAIQNPSNSEYIITWTGWTENIDVNPKRYGDNMASLSCSQGRFQLDKVPFRTLISGDYTADAIMLLLLQSGYASAYAPYQSIFDQSTFANSFFETATELYDLDAGISTLKVSGEEWGANVKASKVLDDIMQIERGWTFIRRDGKVVFFNRQAHTGVTPTDISIDSTANGGNYAFGEGFVNRVRVTYNPKSTVTKLIWETRENIILKSVETKSVTAKLEYEEGKKLTITAVNDTDAGSNPSVVTITRANGTAASNVEVTWELVNGEVNITLQNRNNFPVNVEIELWGNVTESFSGRIMEAALEDDFGDGVMELSEQSKLLTTDETAEDYANFLLATYGRHDGVFSTLKVMSRNSTWLQTQLGIEPGDVINLVEYQTSHNEDYIVVGEDMDWTPGLLTITYHLAPQEKLDYHFIVGVSQLDNNAYYGY